TADTLRPRNVLLRHAAVGHLDLLRLLSVGDVDTAAGDRRTGIAGVDAHPPEDLRPCRRQPIDDAGLAPDAVAPRAAQFPPVLPTGGGWRAGDDESDEPTASAHNVASHEAASFTWDDTTSR